MAARAMVQVHQGGPEGTGVLTSHANLACRQVAGSGESRVRFGISRRPRVCRVMTAVGLAFVSVTVRGDADMEGRGGCLIGPRISVGNFGTESAIALPYYILPQSEERSVAGKFWSR